MTTLSNTASLAPRLLAVVVFTAASLWSQKSRGNDSDAVLEGGRLRLKKSTSVAMEAEDLVITSDRVVASYSFRNLSKADVATRVTFPIGIDSADDWEGALDSKGTTAERIAAFAFKLTVDGKDQAVETEVNRSDKRTEVLFHWPQVFPAGKNVSIRHQYRPQGGFLLAGDAAWTEKDLQDLAARYCIEPTLLQSVKTWEGAASQVHYILHTGANWARPIGQFRLTIRKKSPKSRVSLCADDVRRVDDLTFQVEKRNHSPTRDLKILFIE